MDFKGYKWWTNFQNRGDGSVFPGGGFSYNADLKTAFAPEHVVVDGAGLHLRINDLDLGGGIRPFGAEAVLMFNADRSPANLGFGDYLITATVATASAWAELDPNVTFAAFTYERIGTGSAGNSVNPNREIDLAEISHWGWDHKDDCPGFLRNGPTPQLCDGDAQFALQKHNLDAKNVHRYTIRSGVKTVTLLMQWHGANQPVTFKQYNGVLSIADTHDAAADNSWTSDATTQNQFIPGTGCERFHLNFWNGNYAGTVGGYNPGPNPRFQEVVVTNFEFSPFP